MRKKFLKSDGEIDNPKIDGYIDNDDDKLGSLEKPVDCKYN